MKVTIFTSIYASTLKDKINDFIEKIEKENMEVKEIQYSTVCRGAGDVIYSALITYGNCYTC